MQQPNKIQVLRMATVQTMLDFHTIMELPGNILHIAGTRRVQSNLWKSNLPSTHDRCLGLLMLHQSKLGAKC
uniref:Uncharacterized protein n=1 Tax=Arundo donax TaxID=35708 RepID=A0A0A9G8J9_ARUDO